MWLMALVLVVAGVFFVKDSISATVGDVVAGMEERKLNKQISSRLENTPSQQLRSLALNIMLEDVTRLKAWLETKSILPDDQKQKQINDCQQTLLKQHAHYSAMLGGMQDRDIIALLMKQASEKNYEWRRKLLTHLGG